MKHLKILIILTPLLLFACNSSIEKDYESLKQEVEMTKIVANKNKATTKKFFNELAKGNIERLVDLFADSAVHINPFASGLFPDGANGKEEIREYWKPVPDLFDGMEFLIEDIYAMEDPLIVFVKYKGIIKLKEDAGYYKNDYYSTFKFNDEGKIIEYVEIFNPIVAARGFGLIDKIK